eukprot:143068_1
MEVIQSKEYDDNYKLLCKIGDICVQLSDFEKAHHYYQQSIHENAHNPAAYFKCGRLLHEHMKRQDDAEIMYQKCLQIDPKHDHCLFHYAKLTEAQNNNTKAQQLYENCLQINNTRACVHYRLAKLLISMKKKQNTVVNKKIEYLLQHAIDLNPKIAKYHQEFAMYLQIMNRYNKANHSYKTALDLIEYGDPFLLYEYSQFLLNRLHDRAGALEYLHKASLLSRGESTSFIVDKYNQLKQRNVSTLQSVTERIKMVIYEFDCIITYWNLWEAIDGNIENLYQMRTDFLLEIFGGSDRINRLHMHFEQLLLRTDLTIVILSFNRVDIMVKCMKRVKLYSNGIVFIGSDRSHHLQRIQSKLNDVIKLKDNNEVFSKNQVLYIDDNSDMVRQVSDECRTFYVDNKSADKLPLRGLTLDDFSQIECIVKDKKYVSPSKFKGTKSLISINSDLYFGIRRDVQCISRSNECGDIETLRSIKWARQYDKENSEIFIDFARKYLRFIVAFRNKQYWTSAQIVRQLLNGETGDCLLYQKFGRSLSFLGHCSAADKYYGLALQLLNEKSQGNSSANFSVTYSYAQHLLHTQRYLMAKEYFMQSLDIRQSPSVYYGLARTFHFLEQFNQAEQYFKMALAQSVGEYVYEPLHYNFGHFLRKQRRYEEAKHHFQVCVKNTPYRALNHYWLSDALYQLGEFDEHEFHLQKALEIDPYLPEARKNWSMYYHNEYHIEDAFYNDDEDQDEKYHETKGGPTENSMRATKTREPPPLADGTCYNAEFDRFWYDRFNTKYQEYYDLILKFELNDIRCIIFNQNIESDLKNKINLHKDVLNVIMREIDVYRNEWNQFSKWMKCNQLFDSFYPILHKHGIYTMSVFNHKVPDLLQWNQLVFSYDIHQNTNFKTMIQTFWKAKTRYNECYSTKGLTARTPQ